MRSLRPASWIPWVDDDAVVQTSHPSIDVYEIEHEPEVIDTGLLDWEGNPIYRLEPREKIPFGFHYYPPVKARKGRRKR